MKTEFCVKFELDSSNEGYETQTQALQKFMAQLRGLGVAVCGSITPKEE